MSAGSGYRWSFMAISLFRMDTMRTVECPLLTAVYRADLTVSLLEPMSTGSGYRWSFRQDGHNEDCCMSFIDSCLQGGLNSVPARTHVYWLRLQVIIQTRWTQRGLLNVLFWQLSHRCSFTTDTTRVSFPEIDCSDKIQDTIYHNFLCSIIHQFQIKEEKRSQNWFLGESKPWYLLLQRKMQFMILLSYHGVTLIRSIFITITSRIVSNDIWFFSTRI
jgi:hypothetical protein